MPAFRLTLAPLAAGSLLALSLSSKSQPIPLDVHEWGTFTSLQDESGNALGNINTDDEPVPNFVHDLAGQVLTSPSQLPPTLSRDPKGIVREALPQITMRLETPVLYFHLPPHTPPFRVDVDVAFHGGWLTQFYPNAVAAAPELSFAHIPDPALLTGTLQWHNLVVGDTDPAQRPATTDPVWTAPRNVYAEPLLAAPVPSANPNASPAVAEHEQFLFYRGVGHLDSPVRVVRHSNQLEIHNNTTTLLAIPAAFLADIRPDHTLAYRELGSIDLAANGAASPTNADFPAESYSSDNLAALRSALHDSLQSEGLDADEADALLNTWQNSYFNSPGLRLLFLVPQSWTERTLPLTLSIDTPTLLHVRRVMIGRIEIISPAQRALLQTISAGPASDLSWITPAVSTLTQNNPDTAEKLRHGQLPLSTLPVTVPPDYAAYVALGRFRQALLLDQQAHHPTAALDQFIKAYQLTPYQLQAAPKWAQ